MALASAPDADANGLFAREVCFEPFRGLTFRSERTIHPFDVCEEVAMGGVVVVRAIARAR